MAFQANDGDMVMQHWDANLVLPDLGNGGAMPPQPHDEPQHGDFVPLQPQQGDLMPPQHPNGGPVSLIWAVVALDGAHPPADISNAHFTVVHDHHLDGYGLVKALKDSTNDQTYLIDKYSDFDGYFADVLGCLWFPAGLLFSKHFYRVELDAEFRPVGIKGPYAPCDYIFGFKDGTQHLRRADLSVEYAQPDLARPQLPENADGDDDGDDDDDDLAGQYVYPDPRDLPGARLQDWLFAPQQQQQQQDDQDNDDDDGADADAERDASNFAELDARDPLPCPWWQVPLQREGPSQWTAAELFLLTYEEKRGLFRAGRRRGRRARDGTTKQKKKSPIARWTAFRLEQWGFSRSVASVRQMRGRMSGSWFDNLELMLDDFFLAQGANPVKDLAMMVPARAPMRDNYPEPPEMIAWK